MHTLEQCEIELRAATGAHDHDEMRRLSGEYRASFDRVWSKMSDPERRASELPAKAVELMRWALGVAQAQKARLAEQRREMTAANRYMARPSQRANGYWQANG